MALNYGLGSDMHNLESASPFLEELSISKEASSSSLKEVFGELVNSSQRLFVNLVLLVDLGLIQGICREQF